MADETITVLDSVGSTKTVRLPRASGRAAAADSRPFALDSEAYALLGTISTQLTTLDGRVDGMETLAGATNTLLTTIDGRVDTLEALLGTGNTSLAAIDASLNDIEAQVEDTTTPSLVQVKAFEYETVAASQTDQVIGASGAANDFLGHILIQPGTTSPGTVIVKDGTSAIYTFPGGASSVSSLVPFAVPFGLKALNAGWKITTGANVTVIACGDFT